MQLAFIFGSNILYKWVFFFYYISMVALEGFTYPIMCVLVLNVGAVVKPSFTKQTPNKYYKINGYYGAVLATAVRVIYQTFSGI